MVSTGKVGMSRFTLPYYEMLTHTNTMIIIMIIMIIIMAVIVYLSITVMTMCKKRIQKNNNVFN